MSPEPATNDADYYVLKPDSIQVRIGLRQRRIMYDLFIKSLAVDAETRILDVGVADDATHGEATNYLENWHPHSNRITALGLGDASHLAVTYPGLTFVRGSGLDLPFEDKAFDVVHCSAVIEHVGDAAAQARLVSECARAARRGFFITTPYRWFPIEVHTSIPLIHWLPKPWHRKLLSQIGHSYYAREENLNLMDRGDVASISSRLADFDVKAQFVRLYGFPSNLIIVGARK